MGYRIDEGWEVGFGDRAALSVAPSNPGGPLSTRGLVPQKREALFRHRGAGCEPNPAAMFRRPPG